MFEISATGESVSTLCVVSERAGMPPSVSAVFACAHFVCRERRRAGVGLLSRVPSPPPLAPPVLYGIVMVS